MANSNSGKNPEDAQKKHEDALGNLPPLSDFDSSSTESDSGLPPLGAFDSDKGGKAAPTESVGGLPPIEELSVETPRPTGGNIKAPPAGYQVGEFESPGFDTPVRTPSKERTGFQDLAADSDFSPETPEIGPGPDSDVDTPMFDSAFGGAAGQSFTPTFETPAPTQAMETPMFAETPGSHGGGEAAPAFDEGAFGGGSGFEAGTPVPDFSPDSTLAPKAVTPPPVGKQPKKKVPSVSAGGGSKSILTAIAAGIVCLLVGIGLGPIVANSLTFIPNPLRKVVADNETQIADLKNQVSRMQKLQSPEGGPAVSPERINELLAQQEQLTASINNLGSQEKDAKTKADEATKQLNQVRDDLDKKNEEFVKAQESFEDLQNQTAIVQARQLGLAAEVERLTGQVGNLEEANDRSRTTKESLEHSVDRLLVQVKEGIPLTPPEYSHTSRVEAVEDLKNKIAEAKWVTPALLDSYTDLYLKELKISEANTYFFAKIPVTTRYGDRENMWAECVMRGNWAVIYRTLDGKNIGIYENVAAAGTTPEYGFRPDLPEKQQKEIEMDIFAARTPGFEQKLQALAEKQMITNGSSTPVQQVFSSL